MRRMTKDSVQAYRRKLLADQDGKCILCARELEDVDSVLDHCHKTGECRGVIHRGCNTMLGKIENAAFMTQLSFILNPDRDRSSEEADIDNSALDAFLGNVQDYLRNAKTGVLHHTHKSAQEKKAVARLKAVKKRIADRREASGIAPMVRGRNGRTSKRNQNGED